MTTLGPCNLGIDTQMVLLEYIDRSRVVIELLSMKQGSQSAQEFIVEVEDQARLTRTNTVSITEGDLTRMVLIGGIKDRLLAEKVLAKNSDLKNTVRLIIQKESSKVNAHAMTGRA